MELLQIVQQLETVSTAQILDFGPHQLMKNVLLLVTIVPQAMQVLKEEIQQLELDLIVIIVQQVNISLLQLI